jgi:hypothetical protein
MKYPPINHAQRPVLVPLPNIARPEPPILRKNALIRVQIFPTKVSLRHTFPAKQYLALREVSLVAPTKRKVEWMKRTGQQMRSSPSRGSRRI